MSSVCLICYFTDLFRVFMNTIHIVICLSGKKKSESYRGAEMAVVKTCFLMRISLSPFFTCLRSLCVLICVLLPVVSYVSYTYCL